MIKRFAGAAAALVASVLSSAPTMAWDSFGHMEVAAVAWDQMTPKARDRAITLIKLNPNFDQWVVHGVPAETASKFAFIHAATWPDLIRTEPGYHNDGPRGGDLPPNTPEASQNIGYADKARHKYWHFIDNPFTTDGSPLAPPSAPNAQTQIAAFREMLPSTSSANEDKRSYGLVWLLHLVGDVHQPLHATSRFSKALAGPDNGGNEVRIDCSPGVSCLEATELHAFWDDLLGPNNAQPSTVVAAAGTLPKAEETLTSIADETVWIEESFQLAKSDVYKSPPIGATKEPSTITQEYKDNGQKIAKERIALAGARLAHLVNDAFK
jgi:hypothetical protein